MGSRDLVAFRRYHTLLSVASTPPTGRVALLNTFDMCIVRGDERTPLHRFRFHPGITEPPCSAPISSFSPFPFPTWIFLLPDEQTVTFELFRLRDAQTLFCSWRLNGTSSHPTVLEVKPLISGRSIHALHTENESFNFTPHFLAHGAMWQPYPDLPPITIISNGSYTHTPDWYRNFRYDEDEMRGYPGVEDLANPGVFRFELSEAQSAIMIASADSDIAPHLPFSDSFDTIRSTELRRRSFPDDTEHLELNAQNYLVRRGSGSSIIAGYPWFSDWGRDTLISMRGLTISLGRYDEATAILLAWAGEISEGMLPNTFSDVGAPTLYNTVDAALWFVVGCHSLWSASPFHNSQKDPLLLEAIQQILTHYRAGTRFNIHMDDDGLIACGTKGVQLTWMDAKVGEVVFTPRIGKPVEIQALWINALKIGAEIDPTWRPLLAQATNSFKDRFWNNEAAMLYDVVDVDHCPGTHDASIRPNQLFAVGGLPFSVVSRERGRAIIDACEKHLLITGGVRSLSPLDPHYRGRYHGAQWDRDATYHQGTAWGWLLGPFVEGWVRVRDNSPEAKREAIERFVRPARSLYDEAGPFAFPEIMDGDWPHTPRGAPFQAWTLAEYIRLVKEVLAENR